MLMQRTQHSGRAKYTVAPSIMISVTRLDYPFESCRLAAINSKMRTPSVVCAQIITIGCKDAKARKAE